MITYSPENSTLTIGEATITGVTKARLAHAGNCLSHLINKETTAHEPFERVPLLQVKIDSGIVWIDVSSGEIHTKKPSWFGTKEDTKKMEGEIRDIIAKIRSQK